MLRFITVSSFDRATLHEAGSGKKFYCANLNSKDFSILIQEAHEYFIAGIKYYFHSCYYYFISVPLTFQKKTDMIESISVLNKHNQFQRFVMKSLETNSIKF